MTVESLAQTRDRKLISINRIIIHHTGYIYGERLVQKHKGVEGGESRSITRRQERQTSEKALRHTGKRQAERSAALLVMSHTGKRQTGEVLMTM